MQYLTFWLVLIGLFFSCSENENPPIESDTPATLEDLTKSSQGFSWKILQSLSNAPEYQDKNIVISPISIQTALYMTLNGAQGSTETGMLEALDIQHIIPNGHNEAYENLFKALTEIEESELKMENAVFYDVQKLTPTEFFKSALENFYAADFNDIDFDESASVDIINAWAEDKTEGRIEKILEEISPDEAMFIINALYMKADWLKGFDPASTFKRTFNLTDGSTSEADMMFSDDYRNVYDGEDYKAVELFLQGEKFSVTFILPPASSSMNTFMDGMSSTNFKEFVNTLYEQNLKENRILLTIPKFEISSKFLLNETLKSHGMEDAFNRSTADFTDLGTAGGRIFLSRVLHDTYLKIDEKGIEGAAVTTVGVATTSAPPILTFDRPYMFIIRHIDTGVIIFTGLIYDPLS